MNSGASAEILDLHDEMKILRTAFGQQGDPTRYAQAKSFADLNQNTLTDLNAQLAEAESINTPAGEQSAAALRKEIGITQGQLEFWNGTAEFWKPAE